MDITKIEKKYCIRYKEKDNPSWKQLKLDKKFKFISELTIQFSSLRYFIEKICFANGGRDFLSYFNYPNIEVVDDESKLFLLKLYKIYELKKYKMFFIPVNSEKYKDLKYAYLFNKNTDLESLILYAFLQSIYLQNIYKNLFLTKEDMIMINSILISYEYKFEEEKNKWIIFNGFLRENMLLNQFFQQTQIQGKITRENYEKHLELSFNKMKKEDKNFLSNMRKQFDLQFNSFLQKIHKFQKTNEYKKFHNHCIKTIQPFKFPLKQYFGKNAQIQYKCFLNLLQEFEQNYKKMHLKKSS